MKKIFLYLVILSGIGSSYLFAQESKFKALYLFNFTKYINWNSEQIVIGIVGNSQVLIELESVIKQNPKVRLKKIAGGQGVNDCHMIFLPKSQNRNFALIQEKIGTSPIILVTEAESLIDEGAEMAFYLEDSKLRFVINKGAIEECGVQISSTLLSQGKLVE